MTVVSLYNRLFNRLDNRLHSVNRVVSVDSPVGRTVVGLIQTELMVPIRGSLRSVQRLRSIYQI